MDLEPIQPARSQGRPDLDAQWRDAGLSPMKRRRQPTYGRRASSGFSFVTGIRSFFETPSHSNIGLAKKIDESVPTRMPISMVIAKPCTAVPPNSHRQAMVMAVNTDVMMVRDKVLLIARLRICGVSALRVKRNSSRTRSNTTTLSLIE